MFSPCLLWRGHKRGGTAGESSSPAAGKLQGLFLIGGDEQSPGLRGNLLNDYNPNMSSLALPVICFRKSDSAGQKKVRKV